MDHQNSRPRHFPVSLLDTVRITKDIAASIPLQAWFIYHAMLSLTKCIFPVQINHRPRHLHHRLVVYPLGFKYLSILLIRSGTSSRSHSSPPSVPCVYTMRPASTLPARVSIPTDSPTAPSTTSSQQVWNPHATSRDAVSTQPVTHTAPSHSTMTSVHPMVTRKIRPKTFFATKHPKKNLIAGLLYIQNFSYSTIGTYLLHSGHQRPELEGCYG